jgi:hypothetical protein
LSDIKISLDDPLERPVVLGRSVGPGGATLRCNFYAEVTESDPSTRRVAAVRREPLRSLAEALQNQAIAA